MATIKLTSKRQATLPAALCADLGIAAGDSLEVVRVRHKNEAVWALKPVPKAQSTWIGSLSRYAGAAQRPWTREAHGEAAARLMAKEAGK